MISGNVNEGMFITVGGDMVLGNFIGTNAAGTAALGNGLSGITVQGCSRQYHQRKHHFGQRHVASRRSRDRTHSIWELSQNLYPGKLHRYRFRRRECPA